MGAAQRFDGAHDPTSGRFERLPDQAAGAEQPDHGQHVDIGSDIEGYEPAHAFPQAGPDQPHAVAFEEIERSDDRDEREQGECDASDGQSG
jgi:hypothetical protein